MNSMQEFLGKLNAKWFTLDRHWQIGIIVLTVILVLAAVGLGFQALGITGSPYPSGEGS